MHLGRPVCEVVAVVGSSLEKQRGDARCQGKTLHLPQPHPLLLCQFFVSLGFFLHTLSRRTTQLPLHQLRKSAVLVGCEFAIWAHLSDFAICADADDCVTTLNRRESMGDRYGCVVASEKTLKSLVHESFGFGIKG